LDLERNQLVVGTRDEMGFTALIAHQVDFVSGVWPAQRFECEVAVRYRGTRYHSEIEPLNDGKVRVHFADVPSAVAPGQAVVFYRGDEVLGGGTISVAENLPPVVTI
jgi:tRNA-specific 2-thiouridylase